MDDPKSPKHPNVEHDPPTYPYERWERQRDLLINGIGTTTGRTSSTESPKV